MSARRIARLGAVALTLSVVGVVAPVRAAEPAPAVRIVGPASMTPPHAVKTLLPDGTASVSSPAFDRRALLKAADFSKGVRGSLDVTRAMLAQQGIVTPDLDPATSLNFAGDAGGLSPQSHEEELVDPTGKTAYAQAAGDFDGDGRDDAIVYEFDLTLEQIVIAARNGVDGAELWRRAATPAVDGLAYPIDDVTGDGRPDLLRHTVRILSEAYDSRNCDSPFDCEYERYDETYRWTYGVVDGSDGADLWATDVDGELHYLWESEATSSLLDESRSERGSFTSTNYFVGLIEGGDYDRDGAAEVVVDAIDVFETYEQEYSARLAGVMEDSSVDYRLNSATRAAALDGTTGAAVLTRSSEPSPSLAFLVPAGQMVGDDTPDLLWDADEIAPYEASCQRTNLVVDYEEQCAVDSDGSTRHAVTLIDGATLTEVWTNRGGEVRFGAAYPVPDVSGDGVADVLVFEVGTEGFFQTMSSFVSGADGGLLWQADGLPMKLGEDLAGDGSPDVLLVEWRHDEAEATFVFTWAAGATGQTLASETRVVDVAVQDANFAYTSLYGMRDGGGTAATDVLISAAELRVPSGTDAGDEDSHVVVVDGRVGEAPVLDARTDEFRWIDPWVDLTGDGLVDGLVGDAEFTTGDGWITIRFSYVGAQRIVDDTRLWTVGPNEYIDRGGEQDGTPGEEVMRTAVTRAEGDVYSARVGAADGATGAERWAFTVA